MAIRFASQKGIVEIVNLLLNDPRVDPSVSGNYAIICASENGHYDIVKLLLNDPRANPHYRAFEVAKRESRKDYSDIMLTLMLNNGSGDPYDNNFEAIKGALKHKNYEIVKLLLDDGRLKQEKNSHELIEIYHEIIELSSKDEQVASIFSQDMEYMRKYIFKSASKY